MKKMNDVWGLAMIEDTLLALLKVPIPKIHVHVSRDVVFRIHGVLSFNTIINLAQSASFWGRTWGEFLKDCIEICSLRFNQLLYLGSKAVVARLNRLELRVYCLIV